METPIWKQIAKFVQEKKKKKQWMAVFVFMAVIVGFGTVTALKVVGQAMTQKEHVLDCQLQLHEHTKGCYDSNKNVVCGYADYVVHKHNDDCRNSEGKLICRLPEVEKHEHTKKCYEKTKTLVCGQEESAGHKHTDECYTTQKGDLKCRTEEHSHSDGCYDEEGNLVCGMDEHQHDDSCYKWEDVLTCKEKEGEGGHKHTDKCYDVQETLTCGKLELHTHKDKCFEKIDKNGKDEPENLRLVCGETELLEHTHTEDAGCLRTVDAAEADAIQAEIEEKAEETADDASEEEREIFTTDLNEEEEKGEDSDAVEGEDAEVTEGEDAAEAEGEEGEVADEAEPESYEESKTYEGLGYIVTASYNSDANIPEEAKLVAEQITEESDSDSYKKHEAEFKKNMDDEDAILSALFKIGFYVDGEEVEPESPVLITIQFVDKNGLPEGKAIKVVHFGDEETEVIDGGKAESGSTSFKTKSFSVFGVGYNGTDADSASVHISESYEYEDAAFHITFHVEGDAKELEKSEEDNDADIESEETLSGEDSEAAEEEKSSEESEEADSEEADDESSENEEESTEGKGLEFKLSHLDKDSEEYKAVVDNAAEANDGSELLLVQTFSYSMYYNGVELDLSDCKITAEVKAAEALTSHVEESIPDAIAYLRDEGDVSEEDETTIEDELQTEFAIGLVGIDGATATVLGEQVLTQDNVDSTVSREVPQTFAARASGQPNPKFTVQYYANLDVLAETGTNPVTMIDTSGKKLPTNKGNTTTSPTGKNKNMYVDANGNVQTDKKLTEVYSSRNFEYYLAPTINYMNALVENTNYALKEVWVLKSGKQANSINKADWDIHTYDANLHFTNREVSAESGKYILIKDNAVIRFVYDTTTKDKDFKAAFYDYDISNGLIFRTKTPADYSGYNRKTAGDVFNGNTIKDSFLTWAKGNSAWDGHIYTYTKATGINSSGNYSGSGTKLAFGNVNTGTTLGKLTWSSNELNKYNNKGYQGCTFGLVTGMSDGKVQYASGVSAPKLFNEGSATGKTAYDNGEYSLKYNRVGDTYTLSAVNGTGATNLGKFTNPKNSQGNYDGNHGNGIIWTNNFWPMDSASSFGTGTHDVKFGASEYFKDKTHELRFGPSTERGTDYTFPESDDGLNHNSYFGMHYEVEFDLVKDYVGPLEYYFFGDDDMWVFLDDKLVCDIGGVHSSVGEYVNLWDYLEKGSEGAHKLSFFYTERGASGSTCWMQFTLPSVSSLTPETTDEDYGQLKIEKTVTEINGKNETVVDNGDEFSFTINLTDENGNQLPDDYSYVKYGHKPYAQNEKGCCYNAKGEKICGEEKGHIEIGHDLIIWDGGDFTLKNGEYIIIKYLPKGTKYTVIEANGAITITQKDGKDVSESSKVEYSTDITVSGTKTGDNLEDNKKAEGTINKGTAEVKYNNKYYLYELPKTGGPGLMLYTMAGILLILVGVSLMYTKKARERRA